MKNVGKKLKIAVACMAFAASFLNFNVNMKSGSESLLDMVTLGQQASAAAAAGETCVFWQPNLSCTKASAGNCYCGL